MNRILIIDDDAELCALVGRFLKSEGFAVDRAADGTQGIERALSGSYALVMLDVMMPGLSGFDVLRRIRARSRTPVLMLTARGDTHDRILGLELGADDYLPKPYDPAELAARIRAILRRSKSPAGSPASAPLAVDDIELTASTRAVTRAGQTVELTGVEFDLLEALMKAAGTVVNREDLVRTVLGREFSPYDRSIDTHVCNLRRKIGRLTDGTDRIKGIRGTGYLYAKSVLKILLASFLTVIFAGISIVLPMAVIIPSGGGGLLQFAAILAVGISGLVCVVLTRHITSPLLELRMGTAAIAAGNLAARVSGTLRNRHDEIGQLGRDFDRMAERLESLVDGHKRLLGDVSHELRSPLSRLLVALGLTRKSTAEEMPELLDRIALEAKRLDTLIGQLLTLSRIESGSHATAASSIDLTALVHEVVSDADFEARANSRRVAVTAFDECTVSGAEELLRSAIENVVRNAVRYTPVDTAVDVSIRRERDRAVIRVRDRGPGAPDAMLSEIFLPFRRVQTMDAPSEGSGLGLAIAQRAVAANGGTIIARNGLDGGLIVDIAVPVSPAFSSPDS